MLDDSSRLVVCLMDGPYILRGGRPAAVPEGGKRLLVFVALHGGRVDRRHAAGILWPDVTEHRASGNLRSALWRLRSAGIDVVETTSTTINISPNIVIDIRTIVDWSDRIIHGDPATADLAVPESAPHVVELLPGWYDDWVLIERERLRQKLLHALETLCGRLLALGKFAEAIDAAMGAIAIEPLRESSQRALVEAHLAEGNLNEARRAFDNYVRLAFDELGVLPSTPYMQLITEHLRSRQRTDLVTTSSGSTDLR